MDSQNVHHPFSYGDINDCKKDDKLDCNDEGEEDVNGKNE